MNNKTIFLLLFILLLSACTSNQVNQEGTWVMHNTLYLDSEEVFLKEMIPHHQEAIDTSLYMLEHSDNELILDLAQRIVQAQIEEISFMNEFLEKNYPLSEYEANYIDMMDDLTLYEGLELERIYLAGMIHHHLMAVEMAEAVLKLEISVEVKELAENILEIQEEEIEEMIYILQNLN